MKKIKFINSPQQQHWVGNGFLVNTLFQPTQDLYPFTSPFLMLDYASPKKFPKSTARPGVGEHPHRGFETVTFAYQGEIEHRDSSGGGGIIGPGDVQWMTAGKGVVHDEFHSTEFSSQEGTFEMVQLWVNLPKEYKMINPRYQEVKNQDFPRIKPSEGVEVKLIAGEFQGKKGACQTFSTMNVFDIEMNFEQKLNLEFKSGTNTILLVLRGSVNIESIKLNSKDLVIFERDGNEVLIQSSEDSKLLVLNGEPLDGPMIAHGPFVMTNKQEITEAIEDYQSGKMGKL